MMKKFYDDMKVNQIHAQVGISRQAIQRVVDVVWRELGLSPNLAQLKKLYEDKAADSLAFERFIGQVITGDPGGAANLSKEQWSKLMKVGARLPGRPNVSHLNDKFLVVEGGKVRLAEGLRERIIDQFAVKPSAEKQAVAEWIERYCQIVNTRPRELGWVGGSISRPRFTKQATDGRLILDTDKLFGRVVR